MPATTAPTGKRTPLQWAVQIFGELLITVGLVLLLFVAWQLWWTNIEANSTQQDAVDSLIQEFEAADPGITAVPVAPTNSETDAAAETTDQGTDQLPEGNTETTEDAGTIEYNPHDPPVATAPAYGQAYGVVYIPKLATNYARPLAEGAGSDVLDTLGLGRYPDTQMPGQIGNFALAGHRQTNGAVLDHIDLLESGDNIYVRTAQGYYTYRVYQSKIVLPREVEVIAPNPDDPTASVDAAERRLLTLTSCHPRYGDTERYIVHAEFVEWQPNAAGAPQEIAHIAG